MRRDGMQRLPRPPQVGPPHAPREFAKVAGVGPPFWAAHPVELRTVLASRAFLVLLLVEVADARMGRARAISSNHNTRDTAPPTMSGEVAGEVEVLWVADVVADEAGMGAPRLHRDLT